MLEIKNPDTVLIKFLRKKSAYIKQKKTLV